MDYIDWPNGYFSLICEYFAKLCCLFHHHSSRRQIFGYRFSIYGAKKSTYILENQLMPFSILIRYLPFFNDLKI